MPLQLSREDVEGRRRAADQARAQAVASFDVSKDSTTFVVVFVFCISPYT